MSKKSKKNPNKNPFQYTVTRWKNGGGLYGPVHGADHHYNGKGSVNAVLPEMTSLCGKTVTGDGKWYILSSNHTGDVTCKKCLATLDKDEDEPK